MPILRMSELAHQIDSHPFRFRVHELQHIRKRLKGFDRRPCSTIFHDETICDDEGWAHHYGGRKELQFNIGLEEEGYRYGFAFSLETSRTLPNISDLFPKVRRFNQFYRENPGFFNDYSMWTWHKNTKKRSGIYTVREIPADLLKRDTFIFIGKLVPSDTLEIKDILSTFDELLTPYVYVEKEPCSGIIEAETRQDFEFTPGSPTLIYSRRFTSTEKAADLNVRHSLIQKKLAFDLAANHGAENVGVENSCFGKKIDVVLQQGKEYTFYEIKTCGTAKGCIREALGQVMEYAFWPGRRLASKIVIVGEYEIDPQTQAYLDFLKIEFDLPLEYLKIDID